MEKEEKRKIEKLKNKEEKIEKVDNSNLFSKISSNFPGGVINKKGTK